MLVPFLIMMREGIEAALIVGIIASYLKQTERSSWMPFVWMGVVLAALLSLAVGLGLNLIAAEYPQRVQEGFEAAVGLVAVLILTSMVFWMKKAAHSIKAHLHDSIDNATRDGQGLALVAMAFFAVAREGLESVFFLMATFQQGTGWAAFIGAVLGLAVALGIGVGIYYGGIKLNLRHFFRWTGAFILVVAAGLLSGALRSAHEAGLWNGLQKTAFDWTAVLPDDSPLGTVLAGIFGYSATPTVGEVAIYILFLVVTLPLFFVGGQTRRTAGSHA